MGLKPNTFTNDTIATLRPEVYVLIRMQHGVIKALGAYESKSEAQAARIHDPDNLFILPAAVHYQVRDND